MADIIKLDLLMLWGDYKSGKIDSDFILNYVKEVYEEEEKKLLGD